MEDVQVGENIQNIKKVPLHIETDVDDINTEYINDTEDTVQDHENLMVYFRYIELSLKNMRYVKSINFEKYIQNNVVDNKYEIYRISKLFIPLNKEEMERQKKYLSTDDLFFELSMTGIFLNYVRVYYNNDCEMIYTLLKYIYTLIVINREMLSTKLDTYYTHMMSVLAFGNFIPKLYHKFMPILSKSEYDETLNIYKNNLPKNFKLEKIISKKKYKTSTNLKYIILVNKLVEDSIFGYDYWESLGEDLWCSSLDKTTRGCVAQIRSASKNMKDNFYTYNKEELFLLHTCICNNINEYKLKINNIYTTFRSHLLGK